MKKLVFLFLLLSSQFAYGEEGFEYGCGDIANAVVHDAVSVHVNTTTGTSPFKLGSTSAATDYIFIIYKDAEGTMYGWDYLISEVCIQQLGDSMAILFDNEVLEIFRVLPGTEVYHHVYAP